MSSNNNRNNNRNNKNKSSRESEIIIYSPGEIDVNFKSDTKYFTISRRGLDYIENNRMCQAILGGIRCYNRGNCGPNEEEDEVVFIAFDYKTKQLSMSDQEKNINDFEYVPKAYICIISDEIEFNKYRFKTITNKKTIEQIEEELISNYSYFLEVIENIKKIRLNRSNNLKNKNIKQNLRKYRMEITREGINERSEESNRLLDYYLINL
jgi:hypothetical protein